MTGPCLARPQPRSPEAPPAKGDPRAAGAQGSLLPRVGAQRQTQAGCPLALAGQVTRGKGCGSAGA